jgi:glycosyltransferase involved in cell wall biosynthesis
MDIAFVNRMAGITRGGGEIWDLKMAEQLEGLGAEVTFYVGKPLRSELSEPIEEFEYVEVPTPHLRNLAYAAPIGIGGLLSDIDARLFTGRVVRRLHERDHDIIHVNSDPQFGRVVSEFDMPVTIKMNGPPHSLWYDYVSPFTSSYDFFQYFDSIIATGITTEKIQERVSHEVHTINPGVDTNEFTPDGPTVEIDSPSVLFVGRFVPAKNLGLLVEAFAEVVKQFPSAELILIGDGPLKHKIRDRIQKLGLENRVRMPGYIDNANLPQYYRSADVVALSSRRENHPITLLEAMSCGTPVVAPEIGAIPEIVDDGTNGLLYPTGNADALNKVLQQTLSDDDLRSRLGAAGSKKAQMEYDWHSRAEGLYRLFRKEIK